MACKRIRIRIFLNNLNINIQLKQIMQKSNKSKYSLSIRLLCMAAFTYVILAYINDYYYRNIIKEAGSLSIFFSRFTEYIIIALFGIWRIAVEKNKYTRKRFIGLVLIVLVLYWFVPQYFKIEEWFVGGPPKNPIFPSIHLPGTFSFFVVIVLVIFFGRKIKCGWGCPCVAIRETVGFAFRDKTVKSKKAFKFRHIKWLFLVLYIILFIMILSHSSKTSSFFRIFMGLIMLPYFLTMILSPLIGNRGQCRFICPYAATFGLLNRIGFYKVVADKEKCIECGVCDKECDMGIPVCEQINKYGHIKTIEECMGCARCITKCPKNVLEIKDIRNVFNPDIRRDKNYFKK